MARVKIPSGEGSEAKRIWSMSGPGQAALPLIAAMYDSERLLLPPRTREAARMAIAHHNGCHICQSHRVPEYADAGVDEELYAHVDDPGHSTYSPSEAIAVEYAHRFASDHRNIDDAFFSRLHEHFTDNEIVELTTLLGCWLGFGRLTALLDLDEACSWQPHRD
jgi:alkylhydroperoxidase family enzyme